VKNLLRKIYIVNQYKWRNEAHKKHNMRVSKKRLVPRRNT